MIPFLFILKNMYLFIQNRLTRCAERNKLKIDDTKQKIKRFKTYHIILYVQHRKLHNE